MPPNGNNGMCTFNLREGEIQNSEFIDAAESPRLDSMNIDCGHFSSENEMLIEVEGMNLMSCLGP
jgi:hypothetical protein